MAALFAAIRYALAQVLSPPPIPYYRALPGTRHTIDSILHLFYWRGALDGFLLGTIFVLVIQPRIKQWRDRP